MRDKKDIVFLTYVNRSGSTYLARLLNDYSDIGVSLEARLPDGIERKEVSVDNKDGVQKLIDKLFRDRKFREWGLDRKKLRFIFNKKDKPVNYEQILKILLESYFKKQGKKNNIFIYKKGIMYLRYLNLIRKKIPQAKVIFLMRDPRAIYNSQKKSLDTRTQRPMSQNPYQTAYLWNKDVSRLERFRDKRWFYLLKYEDLINNQKNELDELLNFLRSKKNKSKENEYEKNIPEGQRYLHENIGDKPIKERISAWQKELNKNEIATIERVAGLKLQEYDYDLYIKEQKAIYTAFYLVSKIKYYCKRILDKFRLLMSPRELVNRIFLRIENFKVKINKKQKN